MKLKEKFLPFVDDIDLINDIPNKEWGLRNANKCEKIADEFAIGFIKWYASNEGMDLIHDLQIIGEIGKNVTPEQLLEIYKKDKGL